MVLVKEVVPESHPCEECGRVLGSAQKLLAHKAAAHGHRRWVSAIFSSDECPCCKKRFGTRIRAMHHGQHSAPRCREWLIEHFSELRLSDEQQEVLANQDRLLYAAAKRSGVHVLAR